MTVPRVTLLSKPGCHLCDDALEVVRRVCADVGAGWAEQNILDDPVLTSEYAEKIPVVLIDGEVHTYWRVDEERLRAALTP